MANTDAPRGLRFVRTVTGGTKPKILHVRAKASVDVFIGDIVRLDAASNGDAEALDDTSVGTDIVGVSIARVESSTTQVTFPIISAHGSVFEVQYAPGYANENAIRDDISDGTNLDTQNNGTGATGLDFSTCEAIATVANPSLRVVGWPDRPDNEFGANMKIHVRFMTSVLVLAAPAYVTNA